MSVGNCLADDSISFTVKSEVGKTQNLRISLEYQADLQDLIR